MMKFLDNSSSEIGPTGFGGYGDAVSKRPSRSRKIVMTIFGIFSTLLIVGAVGGYLYWQSFKTTPQYSLAMLVDAAQRNDEAEMERYIAIDSVVDEFVPQITDKAIEIYGRGLPPQTIARVARVANPVMPALKERARAQLPNVIRKKAARFGSVPFAAMVLGADRYLDIRLSGDIATVTSKLPEHSFEVRMQRNGSTWKIVGLHDEGLATDIAQKVGQEIIAIAASGGGDAAGNKLGIKNLNTLLQQAEDIFR